MHISEKFWFGLQPFNGTVYPLPTIYFQRYYIWAGINFVWLWFRAELLVKNRKWKTIETLAAGGRKDGE